MVGSSLVGSSVGEVVVSVVSLVLVVWSLVLGSSASLPQAVSVSRARVSDVVILVRMVSILGAKKGGIVSIVEILPPFS